MLTQAHITLENDPSEEGATDSEVKVQVGRKMGQQIVLKKSTWKSSYGSKIWTLFQFKVEVRPTAWTQMIFRFLCHIWDTLNNNWDHMATYLPRDLNCGPCLSSLCDWWEHYSLSDNNSEYGSDLSAAHD